MSLKTQFKYRPDIDGLRTIAVLSVIFYHAFPHRLPGGFVGVDIFFVISGFLITGILFKEIATSTFSIKSFYVRRIKRLFPALALMFIGTLAIGWYMLLPHEFAQLGKHTVGGAGFIANLVFWSETGYFDSSSELKPLLHLWSLGVEEQFYILWPLAIALAYRLRWNFGFCALVLLGLSFLVNLMLVEKAPSSAFFLPHARFWELIAGGLLAYAYSRGYGQQADKANSVQQLSAVGGLLMLFAAIWFINSDHAFPGWAALLPVAGSVMLIAAGPASWVGKYFLSSKPMVAIGLISYPLYLWHWPLFSFAHIHYAASPPETVVYGLILLTFALAFLTYRCVELPLKSMSRNPVNANRIVIGLTLTMLVILLLGALIFLKQVPGRLAHLNAHSEAYGDWQYKGDKASSITGTEKGAVLFFGDSFMRQYAPRVAALAENNQAFKSVTFHTAAGCVPIPSLARTTYPECEEYALKGFELAQSDAFDSVLLASSWLGMLYRGDYYWRDDSSQQSIDFFNEEQLDAAYTDLENAIASLLKTGKKVSLVLHPPGGEIAGPGYYPNRLTIEPELLPKEITRNQHLARTDIVNSRLSALGKRLGIKLIDPADWFCNGDSCSFSDDSNVPLFKDNTHIRNSHASCCIDAFDNLVLPWRSSTVEFTDSGDK